VDANVRICSRGLANPEQGNIKTKANNSKAKETRHVVGTTENYGTLNHPELGARAGLFIMEDQGYYITRGQCHNCPLTTCLTNRVYS
jgi:hypothetical protein